MITLQPKENASMADSNAKQKLTAKEKRRLRDELGQELREEAQRGDALQVTRLMGSPWVGEAVVGLALVEAARWGHVACVEVLAQAAPEKMGEALVEAAKAGKLACVEFLAPRSPQEFRQKAMVEAARAGRLPCVEALVQWADPKVGESAALRAAAQEGKARCVEFLLPLSDPKALGSAALRWAAKGGHASCVKLLVGVSDAKRAAATLGHGACVEMLLAVSSWRSKDRLGRDALTLAKENGRLGVARQVESFEAREEARDLGEAIGPAGAPKAPGKRL